MLNKSWDFIKFDGVQSVSIWSCLLATFSEYATAKFASSISTNTPRRMHSALDKHSFAKIQILCCWLQHTERFVHDYIFDTHKHPSIAHELGNLALEPLVSHIFPVHQFRSSSPKFWFSFPRGPKQKYGWYFANFACANNAVLRFWRTTPSQLVGLLKLQPRANYNRMSLWQVLMCFQWVSCGERWKTRMHQYVYGLECINIYMPCISRPQL